MTSKELYDKIFTEYPGSLGYGPAVIALAICVAIVATLGIGGYTLGKEVLAKTFGVELTELQGQGTRGAPDGNLRSV